MDMKDTVYDHSYGLPTVIVIQKRMEAVSWSAVFSFSAAHWFPSSFAQGEVSLFSNAGNICVTVQGFRHRLDLHFITTIPWRRTPPLWEPARAQATAFLNELYPSHTLSPSPVEIIDRTITSIIPLSTKSLRSEPSIHPFSAVPSTVPALM